jgi:hypothetical protein
MGEKVKLKSFGGLPEEGPDRNGFSTRILNFPELKSI